MQNVHTARPDSQGQLRMVIVDNHYIFREALAALLRMDPHLQVVGLGANGREAIDLVENLRPDILLLDLRMPLMDGIQATREIKQRWPDVRIIVLTAHAHEGCVVESLLAGADGFLLKDSPPLDLRSGIEAVAAGKRVVEPGVASRVGAILEAHQLSRDHSFDGLTERELQMVVMIARGLVAKEIAHELRLSEKTVRNHIGHIYRKLGVFDRTQIVLYAAKKGMLKEAS